MRKDKQIHYTHTNTKCDLLVAQSKTQTLERELETIGAAVCHGACCSAIFPRLVPRRRRVNSLRRNRAKGIRGNPPVDSLS